MHHAVKVRTQHCYSPCWSFAKQHSLCVVCFKLDSSILSILMKKRKKKKRLWKANYRVSVYPWSFSGSWLTKCVDRIGSLIWFLIVQFKHLPVLFKDYIESVSWGISAQVSCKAKRKFSITVWVEKKKRKEKGGENKKSFVESLWGDANHWLMIIAFSLLLS